MCPDQMFCAFCTNSVRHSTASSHESLACSQNCASKPFVRGTMERRMFDHRRNQATSTLTYNRFGTSRAFATAKAPRKFAVSSGPPSANLTSEDDQPSTTSPSPTSSGCRLDAKQRPKLCRWPTGPHQTVTAHLPQPPDDGHRSVLGNPTDVELCTTISREESDRITGVITAQKIKYVHIKTVDASAAM